MTFVWEYYIGINLVDDLCHSFNTTFRIPLITTVYYSDNTMDVVRILLPIHTNLDLSPEATALASKICVSPL